MVLGSRGGTGGVGSSISDCAVLRGGGGGCCLLDSVVAASCSWRAVALASVVRRGRRRITHHENMAMQSGAHEIEYRRRQRKERIRLVRSFDTM